jgi:Leucine-rich repeat (LRR) protein
LRTSVRFGCGVANTWIKCPNRSAPFDSFFLDLGDCRILKLPSSIGGLCQLTWLSINHCASLQALPKSLTLLTALQTLFLMSCDSLQSLPGALGSLRQLEYLELRFCSSLGSLPKSTSCLQSLSRFGAEGDLLASFSGLGLLTNLTELVAYGSKQTTFPDSILCLQSLTKLDLSHWKKLRHVPEEIRRLTALKELCLSDCSALTRLPDCLGGLTALAVLDIFGCYKLVDIPQALASRGGLQIIHDKGPTWPKGECHNFFERWGASC